MNSNWRFLLCVLLALTTLADVALAKRNRRRKRQGLGTAPLFNSFKNLGFGQKGIVKPDEGALAQLSNVLSAIQGQGGILSLGQQSDVKANAINPNSQPQLGPSRVNLGDLTSGSFPGLAPIPVPGFPGPSDVRQIPGVNTIPGLNNFNYIIGQLIPQTIPPTNTLLGASISRLLPQGSTKNLAKDVFRALHPQAAAIEVDRMMGRWFQVITSPHVIREACTVSHFGALTNTSYSATFTVLKFFREGNPNGPPRFALGYGFKAGESGQFVIHSSNSPDSEPFWVIKTGPLNDFNQYDYAVISNWIRFPVFVIARDPERFRQRYMKDVLKFLENNQYINIMTKAFNLIAPVDYSQCQYTPTFSGAG